MVTSNSSAVVSVAPGSSLPYGVVEAFLNVVQLQPSSLTFFNPHGEAASRSATEPAAAGLACVGTSSRQHNREAFAAFATTLAPGARLYVHVHDNSSADAASTGGVHKDLVLSGFTDVKDETVAGLALIQAVKPAWNLGAKSLLRKPPTVAAAAQPAAPAPAAAAKTWAIDASDANDELMDDDELLTEEDKLPVKLPKAEDDCDIGKTGKKACKNCSCGRAEQEQQGTVAKLTADMLEAPQSACGSCYLGDAFRCATCPYKGLPAFEAGKKIELPRDMLVADV